MNEQIKKYISPIKNFWGKLSKKVKIIIFSVLGGIIVISLVMGIIMNQPKYAVLYPKLSDSEATEVMNELKTLNVDYKENGGTISVPAEKENSLRMQLANEGYPKSTTNYDFFTTNVSLMTTDAERKTIEKYQLNLRLESVIKTIDTVKSANVTITIPDTSSYAWDDNKETPSASVTIGLDSGKTLSTTQVAGIKQLVAKSVPNMTTDEVSVIDQSTGEELSSDTSYTQIDFSKFKLEIQKQYENDMKKKVMDILKPTFGAGHVNATVTCIMDIDKKIQESVTYKPSTDNKGVTQEQTIQKEQTTGSSSSAGGVVGTQSNTGVTSSTSSTSSGSTTTTTYPGITVNGNTIYSTDAESYKYLVSQVKEQIQADSASVKDLSIAVVIDNATMTAQQKADVSKLVASAAAILPSKVAIYNSTFAKDPTTPVNNLGIFSTLSTTTLMIAGGILVLLLILLFVSIMIASKRKKKLRLLMAGFDEDEVSTEDIGEDFGTGDLKGPLSDAVADEDMDAVEHEDSKKIEKKVHIAQVDDIQSHRDSLDSQDEALKKELKDFSSQNPEIAAQLIRTWLRGDDHNG